MAESFNSNFRETDNLMQVDDALSGGLSEDIATGRIFGTIPPSNPTSTLSAVTERAIQRVANSTVDDPLNDSGPASRAPTRDSVGSLTISRIGDAGAFGAPYHFLKGFAGENTSFRVRSRSAGIDFVMPAFEGEGDFIRWYKGGGHYHFVVDSTTPRMGVGDTLDVTPTTALPDPLPTQQFAHGISHCLLGPIHEWSQAKVDAASNKQARWRYGTITKKVGELKELYKDGVPEDAIGSICDLLQVDIDIQNPFSERVYIEGRSQKKRLCKFSYMNTRINHVDQITNTLSSATIDVDREFINAKIDELESSGEFYTYRKDAGGVCGLNTLSEIYRCTSEHISLVNEFERDPEHNIHQFKIDAIGDKALFDFVSSGIHRNISNFVAIQHNDASGLECLDIVSSFANVHHSDFYEGFPTKLTDMRPCSQIEGPGVYRIRNIDWSSADPKFTQMCALLGDIYNDNTVYPVPDLRALTHYGVGYEIVEGAWAGGRKASIDFRYPGNRRDESGFFAKDEKGVRHYARWMGSLVSNNLTSRVWVRGEPEYFAQVRKNYPDCNACHYQSLDGSVGEGYIEFKRQYAYGLPTFVAYTEALERSIIFKQLMHMDLSKVVCIQKDSITFEPHDFERIDLMVSKPAMVVEYGTNCYLTNLPFSRTTAATEKRSIQLTIPDVMVVSARERAQHPIESNIGVGGGGKTHRNLTDPGLVRPIYISPSWKLAREKKREYKCRCSVNARAFATDPAQYASVLSANVILWDEISMLSMESVVTAVRKFPYHKHIFIGDPGYQLPCLNRSLEIPYWDDLVGRIEAPPSTLPSVVSALTSANVLEPLDWDGTHSVLLKVPKNVYAKLGEFTLESLTALKPIVWTEKANSQWALLRRFLSARSQVVDGEVHVVEKYSFPKTGFRGRVYGCGAGLMGAIRSNILCNTLDLDQKASAHTIILWLCRRYSIACTNLAAYLADREGVLATIAKEEGVDRSTAKRLATSIYMLDKVRFDSKTLRLMDAEANGIQRALMRVPDLKWVLDSVPAGRHNRGGSFLCRAYQHIEQKFTLATSVALEKVGVHTQMLVYDGLAIQKGGIPESRILEIARDVCESLCPGVGMDWSFKDHDYSIKDNADKVIGSFDIRDCAQVPLMVSTEVTPEALEKLGPVFRFDTNFRCKCPKLGELLTFMRRLIDEGTSPDAMYTAFKARLESSNFCSFSEAIEGYEINDMILVSRINAPFPFVAEYTDPLSIRSGQQKYLIRGSDRVYSNGDIVISDTPPSIKHEVRHAFTIHSIQGETARDKLYIDQRKMWSPEIWYTAISRAQYLSQVKIVLASASPGALDASIYKIVSPSTKAVYIGSTVQSLEARLKGHLARKDCMSREVTKFGDATIELVEKLSAKTREDVIDREGWHIQNTPGAVNAVVPLCTASRDDAVDIPPPEPPVKRARVGMSSFDAGRVWADDGSYSFSAPPPVQNFSFTA